MSLNRTHALVARTGLRRDPANPAHDILLGACRRKIVERPVRHADDVRGNERSALGRRDFGMFQAVLPLVDRPAVEIVLGELREDLLEVDLPVAERAVPGRALQPGPDIRNKSPVCRSGETRRPSHESP